MCFWLYGGVCVCVGENTMRFGEDVLAHRLHIMGHGAATALCQTKREHVLLQLFRLCVLFRASTVRPWIS